MSAFQIQKTSTTEAPPLEPEGEEYEDELIEEEPTTTTTEAPKKVGLRGKNNINNNFSHKLAVVDYLENSDKSSITVVRIHHCILFH